MIEIVALIDPFVALVQAILSIPHLAQILTLAVVEFAFEELNAENAENNEKGTAYEHDVSNLF